MKFTAIFVMNKCTFDEEIPLKCHYLIQYGYTLFNQDMQQDLNKKEANVKYANIKLIINH